jgi:hypothetical protein
VRLPFGVLGILMLPCLFLPAHSRAQNEAWRSAIDALTRRGAEGTGFQFEILEDSADKPVTRWTWGQILRMRISPDPIGEVEVSVSSGSPLEFLDSSGVSQSSGAYRLSGPFTQRFRMTRVPAGGNEYIRLSIIDTSSGKPFAWLATSQALTFVEGPTGLSFQGRQLIRQRAPARPFREGLGSPSWMLDRILGKYQ